MQLASKASVAVNLIWDLKNDSNTKHARRCGQQRCKIMCIKVLGGSHRRYAGIGDLIKVTVKEAILAAR